MALRCPSMLLTLLLAACGAPVAEESVDVLHPGVALPDPEDASLVEWRAHGHDLANTRHTPLARIHRGNASGLRIAWRWRSVDEPLRAADSYLAKTMFEATPLMVGGTLFFPTALSRVVALDAASGQVAWVHDPGSHRFPTLVPIGIHSRGVAWWSEGDDRRILFGTSDAHLVALDASTGRPLAAFGDGGRIDLAQGLRRPVDRRFYSVTSPPLVVGDVVVVGSWVPDMPVTKANNLGDVRAFDVRTGEPLWTFETIPRQGEPGSETWGDAGWHSQGNVNVWTTMSADPQLGLVYLPVSMPTDNFYGGLRPGDNLYSDSLVAVEARSGRVRWHRQLIHHDLWDYDVPAAPNLMDLDVDGRRVRGVAQVMKSGFVFVFDRATGAPVWPIEERPVPASTMPGEQASPTQPFPTRPPPFERQGITEDDLIDFTPELRAAAKKVLERYDHGPLFTPVSMRGALLLPGWSGGANWGGAAFDPSSHRLYVASITAPIVVGMKESGLERWLRNRFWHPEDAIESPFEIAFVRWPQSLDELPMLKPPYGRITAYDMDRGEIVWQVANGRGPADHPRLAHLGLGDLGTTGRTSLLATGGLLFAGEGPSSKVLGGDTWFRAFSREDGEKVFEVKLESHVVGAPMSYEVGGRQYVLVATGGFGETHELVAFALPGDEEAAAAP